MRALLTFVGGAGHLDPLLPVARALAAGHPRSVPTSPTTPLAPPELGLARVLDAAAVTPAEVTATVTAALQDEDAHARARAVKADIDALPGHDAVVPRLEQLATH